MMGMAPSSSHQTVSWIGAGLLWLGVSTAAAVVGWEGDAPALADRVATVACTSALLGLVLRWLRVKVGTMTQVRSPGLFVTAAAIAWLMLLVGAVRNADSGIPSIRLLGDLPTGYRYEPLTDAEERRIEQLTPSGWHYVARRVIRRGRVVAATVLVGRDGGVQLSDIRSAIERDLGKQLSSIRLGGHKVLASQLRTGLTILIRQREDVVVCTSLRNPRQVGFLGGAILGD